MSEVKIVGTAHVSQKSIEEVREAVLEFNPDVIAVELDPPRYAAVKKQAAAPEVSEVIESGNFNQLLVQWILSYLQRKVGLDVGVEPGAEMKAAINEAESRGIGLALIDRDLRITLRRFWHALSLLEKIRMVYILAISVLGTSEEKIDVEELKKQDVMEMAMAEFRKFSPNGARALIDERDAYLADQIIRLRNNYERVLVVIGAGHVEGVKKYLDAPETLPPIDDLVKDIKPVPWGKIFGIGVTLVFALFIAAIAFSGVGWDVLAMALIYWVVIHGALTAIFTLAAKGHPLSALTGFAVSWFTALNPLIAAGWFAAIVEAKIRKPAPSDFKRIFEAESFTEMWKIPLFRVVIVAAMANVGSTIGTFAYIFFIIPILHVDPGIIITQGFGNMWAALTSLFAH
jgi:pheromone shutdown-related protein TraB